MANNTATLDAGVKTKRYVYKARGSSGKVVEGTVNAERETDVTKELLRNGLVPLSVKDASGLSLTADFDIRKTAKPRALVITTRQLATMLDSGLNYIEALDVVRADCEDRVLANALGEVRHEIQNGSSFSKAMAKQGQVFPDTVINLITAGESAGKIKDAMNQVADALDAQDQLRAKVKKAMMYPAVVAAISAIVFGFMMLYLVPKFTEAFTDLGGPDAQLPFLTRMVVGASDVMKIGIPIALVLIVPAFFVYRANKHKDGVREVVDPLKLKLPVFGNLFHKMALARISHDLSGLLGAGVERLEALTITANTCGNITMKRALLAARDAQRNGRPLTAPLKEEVLFPATLVTMIEAGEKSGRTAFMLEKAAAIYDRDIDQITDNLSALIEPLFIALLGGMVGVLVIAIYLPYLSIGDVIGG